jgi:hypothetical protein
MPFSGAAGGPLETVKAASNWPPIVSPLFSRSLDGALQI